MTAFQPGPTPSRPVALVNGRVLLDDRFATGEAVVVGGGRIAGLVPTRDLPAAMPRRDLGGRDRHRPGRTGHAAPASRPWYSPSRSMSRRVNSFTRTPG